MLQADEELLKLNVGDLPGVGWQMQKKLEKLGLPSVADVRNSRRELLQRELGAKSGSMASLSTTSGLIHHCYNCIDIRSMPHATAGLLARYRQPSGYV